MVRVGGLRSNIATRSERRAMIDLVGYRRHGHSEVDDPTITQPSRYRKIEAHPPTFRIYAEKIGVDAEPIVQQVRNELDAAQKQALDLEKNPPMRRLPRYWNGYRGGRYDAALEVDTAVPQEELADLGKSLTSSSQRISRSPKDSEASGTARGDGAGQTASRLWHGRSAGIWLAFEAGSSGSDDRAGFAPRNVQPAARGADRRRDRRAIRSAASMSRPIRHGLRFTTRRFPKRRAGI